LDPDRDPFNIEQQAPNYFPRIKKLIKFQRYVIAQRKKHDFELKCIRNADQTPRPSDIVTNSTVSEKGVKSTSILTTGHEKDRVHCHAGLSWRWIAAPPVCHF